MTQLLDDNKIKSMIHLLEDEDDQAYELMHGQILQMGVEMMPYLLDAEDHSINPLLVQRLKNIYRELNLANVLKEMADWKKLNSRNLYQGLIVLAKFQYPRLDLRNVSDIINKIRQDLWLEINDNLTALEKVRIINHLFFDVYNFKGDSQDYYAPENSFINDVLMRRKGNPLNLSAIYSIIAQSVNIPIYGVSMPRNYMLVYVEKLYSQSVEFVDTGDVLFYINPFNRGEIHSINDIKNYIRRIKLEPKNDYFLPCSNVITLQRSVSNIIGIYEKLGDEAKTEDYRKILTVLE
mgnify:CR=1 FL=1